MAQFRGRLPHKFDPGTSDAYDKFIKWKACLENYMIATDLNAAAVEKKLAILYNIAGEEFRLFAKKNCTFNDEHLETLENVLSDIDQILRPQRRNLQYRCKLLDLTQKPDQPIQDYLQDLRAAYSETGYTDATLTGELLVRDLLIRGIRNADAKRLILQQDMDTLTINDCTKLVSTYETVLTNATTSTHGQTDVTDDSTVAAVRNNCRYCGKTHSKKKKCPAFGKICSKCDKPNHFAIVCESGRKEKNASERRKSKNQKTSTSKEQHSKTKKTSRFTKAAAIETTSESSYSDDESSMDSAYAVHAQDGHNGDRVFVTLLANDQKIKFLIDPGSTCTMVPLDYLRKSKDFKLLKNSYVRPWNSSPIKIIAEGSLRLQAKGNQTPINVKAKCIANMQYPLLCYNDYLSLGGNELKLPDIYDVEISAITEPLGTIGTARISLKTDAQPVIQGARKLPFRLQDDVSNELDRMEQQGIIQRVTGPTSWLSPIVVTRRKNGKPRICGDFRRLNKHIERERFVIPSAESFFAKLHGAKYFTSLDLESGFNQILLDEQSSLVTTIATHKGNYRYLRLPFGVSSAPEIFQRVMSDHFKDLPGVLVFVDDILVFGKDRQEHDERLEAANIRLKEIGAKLNKSKCKFAKKSLTYLGHRLSGNGISPDTTKITEALNMRAPTNVKEARRILGMLNYLQRFMPSLSNIVKSIRDILKGKFDQDAVNTCWSNVKSHLRKAANTCFNFYDPKADTAVLTDAGPHGLGAVLLQEHDGEWKPVLTASRSLTSTEERYSQMEKEMLSIVFGAARFRQFIIGGDCQFWTDHKPLERIWNKPFDDVPPRLQRMLLRLTPFGAKIVYRSAKEIMNTLADVLSRSPVSCNKSELSSGDYDQVASLLEGPEFITLQKVSVETSHSQLLSSVIKCVETNDWSNINENIDVYFKDRHSLTVNQNPRLLLHGSRIVIPPSLREKLINLAHDSHLGLKSTLHQLSTVWWPKMSTEVKLSVNRCERCKEFDTCWPEQSLKPSDILPPWHTIAIDIFHVDQKPYLSIVDYGSRYPEVFRVRREITEEITTALDNAFSHRGPTCELMSDNGSQFTSKQFKSFCKSWGIRHRKSAPRYPRANGMIERFHRTFKRRWFRTDAIDEKTRLRRVLYTLRTSYHRMIGTTPLHALTGRHPITPIPSLRAGQIVNAEHQSKVKHAMKIAHDSSKKVVESLPTPNIGERVVIRNSNSVQTTPIRAQVTSATPRRVRVTTETGQDLTRARSHVRTVTRNQTNNTTSDSLVTRSGRIVKQPKRFDPSDETTH